MATDMAEITKLLENVAKLAEFAPDEWTLTSSGRSGHRIGCPDGGFIVIRSTGSSRSGSARRYTAELNKHGYDQAVRDMVAAKRTAAHDRAANQRRDAERQAHKMAARNADTAAITHAAQHAEQQARREQEREQHRREAAEAEQQRQLARRLAVERADAATRAAAGPYNTTLLDPAVVLAAHRTPVFLNGMIGPELAQQILERNPNNRKLRNAKVTDYANQMIAGDWTLSDQGMSIDVDGLVQNGQHRLWAIVESGATIHTIMVLGMPPEAAPNHDTGLHRSFADTVQLRGLPNALLTGATCRLLYAYTTQPLDRWRSWAKTTVHNGNILDMIDGFPRIVEVARHVSAHSSKSIGIVGSALIAGRLLIEREWGHEHPQVVAFFGALDDAGAGLPKEDPRWVMCKYFERARLAALRAGRSRARMSNEEHLWLLLNGWNRYVTNIPTNLRGFTLRIDRPMPAVTCPNDAKVATG